jgi:uncharacterized protein (TIGR02328 family)
MRLFHYAMLPYLPDLQFRGQLREVVAVMRSWRDTGKTNHLLINRVMEYPKGDLTSYFLLYDIEYQKRYLKEHGLIANEFVEFSKPDHFTNTPFKSWHNKEYLRVCMANLYEKHTFGIGKSRITDEEWARLCEGCYNITGEVYKI